MSPKNLSQRGLKTRLVDGGSAVCSGVADLGSAIIRVPVAVFQSIKGVIWGDDDYDASSPAAASSPAPAAMTPAANAPALAAPSPVPAAASGTAARNGTSTLVLPSRTA